MIDWLKNETINNQLMEVKRSIGRELDSGNSYLNQSLGYLLQNSGKMLRPSLLLIGSKFGKLYSSKEEDLIKLGSAIESLHIATLLHDDVIDNAKLRRGAQSIQSKYSKEYSIYMGDFLLSRCFLQLTELSIPKELAIKLAQVINRICIGEILQYQNRNNLNISVLSYLRIISGKTAALFAIALSAGSYITKSSNSVIKDLANAGYQIGMAFQILDDILDFVGDREKVGKDLKIDLAIGNFSLPIIYAIKYDPLVKTKIEEYQSNNLDDSSLNEIFDLIKKSGAIDKCLEIAKKYHTRAIKYIKKLPEGDGQNILLSMMPKLFERVI